MSPASAVWLKFNAVGLAGIAVQLITLGLLQGWVGIATVTATVLAVEASVVHNFLWHERWTWKHRRLNRRGIAGRFARFNMGNGLISLTGNVALMWLLVTQYHIYYLIANATAISVCSTLNFLVSDRIVFKE